MSRVRFRNRIAVSALIYFVLAVGVIFAGEPRVVLKPGIASAHPLATQAGYEILEKGGNAFDAAVVVGASLAVVEPFSSGLGGGGFWLLHRASDGKEIMLDAREAAPLKADAKMFLDETGQLIPKSSLDGARAAAIPGVPAALVWLSDTYGSLPLKTALAPAIRFAERGVIVDERYLCMVRDRFSVLKKNQTSARIFLDRGRMPLAGFRLRQSGLAQTLRAIARSGRAGFYEGRVAKELVATVRAAGGIWTLEDLVRYRVVEREPIKFTYRGARITTAALPSSGGVTLAQSLNILEALPLTSTDRTDRDHYQIEAMRRAYQDRARYLGDPDFVDVPVEKLLSKEYALNRAETIVAARATPSAALSVLEAFEEGSDTTHFSIVDRQGNRVSATLSINTAFGSGFIAGRTGVLLNNHMDDFAVAPGVPNIYGLVGGEANAIAPGKRPLSSMSPSFVEDKKGILIFGTPGGSRIISMVLLGILEFVHSLTLNVETVVNRPRYHHQYLPDLVEIEPRGFDRAWITTMEAKGHSVHVAQRRWGNMQAVVIDTAAGSTTVVNDHRGRACY